jgi:hypothetical protein
VPKRAFVPLKGGEYDAALARLVTVVKQETGHAASLPQHDCADIGGAP